MPTLGGRRVCLAFRGLWMKYEPRVGYEIPNFRAAVRFSESLRLVLVLAKPGQ